jgi:hypothetical protein
MIQLLFNCVVEMQDIILIRCYLFVGRLIFMVFADLTCVLLDALTHTLGKMRIETKSPDRKPLMSELILVTLKKQQKERCKSRFVYFFIKF